MESKLNFPCNSNWEYITDVSWTLRKFAHTCETEKIHDLYTTERHLATSTLDGAATGKFIVGIQEWLLILFRRLFLDIDSATLITEPSLSSLSLSCNGFPRRAFLDFSQKSKLTMRNVRNSK